VLAMRYDWNDRSTIVLHNFADAPRAVRIRLEGPQGRVLMNLLAQERCEADEQGRYVIELEPYGYRWLRVGEMERPIAEERRTLHQR